MEYQRDFFVSRVNSEPTECKSALVQLMSWQRFRAGAWAVAGMTKTYDE